MAVTTQSINDGGKLKFYKADDRASYGFIQNVGGSIVVTAETNQSFLLGTSTNLEFSGAATVKGNGSNAINMGISGNVFNLDVTGVTYNFGTITGSPTITGDLTVQGNLYLLGQTNTVNSNILSVEDKVINLATVATPTDITADGGGIILKGATDKTILWDRATSQWKLNQGLEVTGTINLVGATNPLITFNGSGDTGIDFAIKADPENLIFYEPEDSDKVHFKIMDDTGVDAPFGYWVNGTRIVDASRNLSSIGTIGAGGALTFSFGNANQITTSATNGSIDIRANGTGGYALGYNSGSGNFTYFGGSTSAKFWVDNNGGVYTAGGETYIDSYGTLTFDNTQPVPATPTYPSPQRGFNWNITSDGAGMRVYERGSDMLEYEFVMRDNTQSSDRFVWKVTDWEGEYGRVEALALYGGNALVSSQQYSGWGGLILNAPAVATTERPSSTNTQNYSSCTVVRNNIDQYNPTGLSSVIMSTDVSGYTGTYGTLYLIKIKTTSTFCWSEGGHVGKDVTVAANWTGNDIPLDTNWITLNKGVKIKFNATTGATVNDTYGFRVLAGGGLKVESTFDSYFQGNLGIKTNAPQQDLHIVSSDYGVMRIERGGTGSWDINVGSAGALIFAKTGGTQLYSLTIADGNVGINTATPLDKFHVKLGTDQNFVVRSNSNKVDLYSVSDAGGIYKDLLINGGNITLLGSNGNVGIGTTNPSATLDVSGTIRSFVTGASTSFVAYNPGNGYPRGQFLIGYGSAPVNTGFMIAPADSSSGNSYPTTIEVAMNKNGDDSTNKMISLYQSSTYASIHALGPSGNSAGTPLKFSTQTYAGNNSGIVINNDTNQTVTIGSDTVGSAQLNVIPRSTLNAAYFGGNVGIGTTSPAARLSVIQAGDNLFSGFTVTESDSTRAHQLRIGADSTSTYIFATYATNGNSDIRFLQSSTSNEVMRIKTGNLGVGTANPATRLHVQQDGVSGYAVIRVKNANSTAQLDLGVAGSGVGANTLQNNAYIVNTAASKLGIGSNNKQTLWFDTNGYVGIGTDTPTKVLTIQQPADDNGILIKAPSGGSYPNNSIKLSTNATYPFVNEIISVGRMDIGSNDDQLFLRGTTIFPVGNFVIARVGDATSTATQKDSYPYALQNSLWNGTSNVLVYSGIISKASTTSNQETRLAFITGSSGNYSLSSGSEKMCILSTGNVGIGSTAPIYKLDVTGTGRFTDQLTSTLADGTAPFVVTSKTLITNLNADYLDGLHSTAFGRLVATTSSGNGSDPNTWTKVASINQGTANYQDWALTLAVQGIGGGTGNTIVSFQGRQNTQASPAPGNMVVTIIGGCSAGAYIANDSFIITNEGWGTDFVIWMKKTGGWGTFDITELAKSSCGNLTYYANQGWSSTVPTGTYLVQSSGMKYNGDLVWNASNSNLSTVDWGMKDARIYGNAAVNGYIDLTGALYLREKIYIRNKANSAWLTFADRNTTGSEVVFDLTNIGYIDSNSIIYNNTLANRGNISLLNKAANSWLVFASRNTSGTEALYDLANVGSLTMGSSLYSTSGSFYIVNSSNRNVFQSSWDATRGDYTAIQSGFDWNETEEPISIVASRTYGAIFYKASVAGTPFGVELGRIDLNGNANFAGGRIGFNIYDSFTSNSNTIANYGLSNISGTYHHTALSGYYGLKFYTTGTERIDISSAGNVTLAQSLTVNGNIDVVGDWAWRPSKNFSLTPTSNSQEWSFDIHPGSYTGTFWGVWSDNGKGQMLKVETDTGKVSAMYDLYVGGVSNLTGLVTLGAQATGTGHAVRADRTLQIQGTTNQVIVDKTGNFDLTSNRSWVLSLPQNIHTGATPTFAGITLNGNTLIYGGSLITTGTDGTHASNVMASYNNTGWEGSFFSFRRYRGISSAPTIVSNGDSIGYLDMWGYDGTTLQRSGQLVFGVSGTVSTGKVPGNMVINLADSNGTVNTVFKLESDKSATFYGNTSVNGNVVTTGDLSIGDGKYIYGGSYALLTSSGGNTFVGSAGNTIIRVTGGNALTLTSTTFEAVFLGNLTVNGTGNSSFAGKILIGTTVVSSSAALTVDSGSGQYPVALYMNDSTHATSRRVSLRLGTGWEFGQDLSGNGTKDLYIHDVINGKTRIKIDTSGNVGIGTTNPGRLLDVNGAFRVSGGVYYSGSAACFYTDGNGAQTSKFGGILIGPSYDTTALSGEIRTSANTNLILNARGTGLINFQVGDATKLTLANNGNLTLSGEFFATAKHFRIPDRDTPTKTITYGALEGPENAVYLRGQIHGDKVAKIIIPREWKWLVDFDSITVQLTPIGKFQRLCYEILDGEIIVKSDSIFAKEINFSYLVIGTRKDIPELEVYN